MVITLVGCGRGGILQRVIKAAANCGKKLRLYAVEKNYNTKSYLLAKFKKDIDEGRLSFSFCDVRDFKVEEKSDILVSELLGSFGDNELSPECLDWSEKVLKEDTGISIPSEYSNYLAPMTSPFLWNSLLTLQRSDRLLKDPF